jgi:hypothetical protein
METISRTELAEKIQSKINERFIGAGKVSVQRDGERSFVKLETDGRAPDPEALAYAELRLAALLKVFELDEVRQTA